MRYTPKKEKRKKKRAIENRVHIKLIRSPAPNRSEDMPLHSVIWYLPLSLSLPPARPSENQNSGNHVFHQQDQIRRFLQVRSLFSSSLIPHFLFFNLCYKPYLCVFVLWIVLSICDARNVVVGSRTVFFFFFGFLCIFLINWNRPRVSYYTSVYVCMHMKGIIRTFFWPRWEIGRWYKVLLALGLWMWVSLNM